MGTIEARSASSLVIVCGTGPRGKPGTALGGDLQSREGREAVRRVGTHFCRDIEAGRSRQTVPRFAIPTSVRATVAFEKQSLESQNVVGILPGSDPKLKDEYVVLSAHLDHVGKGEPINNDPIYNGAMDNASGTATLIEAARAFSEKKLRFRRSIVFLAVTAEEHGLKGSRYYAAHPTVPFERIIADINIDMFLPLFPF